MQRPFESIWREPSARDKLSEVKLRPAVRPPPWKVSRLLEHLKRAVGAPRIRQIGKRAANELVAGQIKLKQADLEALERLRRVALRGCRSSTRCPRCDDDRARLLVALNPDVILECSECREVWREGEDRRLIKFRVLCELAVERSEL